MILSKWLGQLASHRSYRVSEAPGILLGDSRTSTTGAVVTETEALSLSGVFAGVLLLARIIGTLPLKVYRQSGNTREQATTHPATRVLGIASNDEMTAATMWRTWEFHRLLWGNAYAEIGWAGSGVVQSLWPIEPWRVKPKRDVGGRLVYEVDGIREVQAADMLHQHLISFDGITGRSWIDFAVESLGLGLSAQEFAARYFGGGARPGVILSHPGTPNEKAREEMRRGWNERHQGTKKAHSTAVLWGGWKFETDGSFDPEKSQLIEQRRFSIEETARWLNIPPHLLRDLSRATFSNIEHQGIDFVVYSLSPVLVEKEQEINRKVLTPPNTYCKHNLAALLRGDSAARSAYYTALSNIGVLCINEIREMEELNPIEGGDTHFVPLNLSPLEDVLAEEEPPPPAPAPVEETPPPEEPPEEEPPAGEPAPAPAPAQQRAYNAMRSLFASTLQRMAKVEGRAIRRLAQRMEGFMRGAEEFYGRHHATLTEALDPVCDAAEMMRVPFGRGAAILASAWCQHTQDALLAATCQARCNEELTAAVEGWADSLESAQASRFADRIVRGEV